MFSHLKNELVLKETVLKTEIVPRKIKKRTKESVERKSECDGKIFYSEGLGRTRIPVFFYGKEYLNNNTDSRPFKLITSTRLKTQKCPH